jgi:hypothetical protein
MCSRETFFYKDGFLPAVVSSGLQLIADKLKIDSFGNNVKKIRLCNDGPFFYRITINDDILN